MSVGYDPVRVRALAHRTRDAIDAARRLTSDDPAAADALRALAAMRRVLDDHWMPALIDVLRSDALTTWSARVQGVRPVHGRPSPIGSPDRIGEWTPLSGLGVAELLRLIERLDADLASSDPPTTAELDEFVRELDRRLDADPDTIDALVARAGELPVIGRLLAESQADADVLVAALAAMTRPVGLVAAVDLERHQASFELVLGALLDDPAGCLAALGDDRVLAALAVWHELDADLVETLVRVGLYDSVAGDPGRLGAGYAVLRRLIELTNGALDHSGIHPAMALGVATSMVGYVDTLAPAIRHEGSARVLVVDHDHDEGRGLEVDLGSYDDVVDLFGAMLRDPAAGAALGTVLAGYANERIDHLGAAIAEPPGLEPVARFTDLLSDAGRAEQMELVMEASAEESRRRTLAGLIGFGAGAAMTASGVGSIARAITTRAISLAAREVMSGAPGRMPEHQLAARTYDLMVLAAIGLAAGDAGVRRAAGLTSTPSVTWGEIRRRVAAIDDEHDPVRRANELVRLERWIAVEVPDLHRFLGDVRSSPGMDELTEARNAVGAD